MWFIFSDFWLVIPIKNSKMFFPWTKVNKSDFFWKLIKPNRMILCWCHGGSSVHVKVVEGRKRARNENCHKDVNNPIPTGGGGGGGRHAPPGKLPQISQECLELQTGDFLTNQMTTIARQKLFFNCLRLHSVTISKNRRRFLNNTYRQFSCKCPPKPRRLLLFPWRVS